MQRLSSSRPRGNLNAASALPARLLERRTEIEGEMLERVLAVADPGQSADVEYAEGVRAAVSAAFEYGIEAVRQRGGPLPPFPTALLTQSRLAARNGVKLDTVLRRYLAACSPISDFLIDELDREGMLDRESLKRLLRSQASLVDHLLATVAAEYASERDQLFRTAEQRRARLVERMLAGESGGSGELGYDLGAWHLGIVVDGDEAAQALRAAAEAVGCRLLSVEAAGGAAWAWLGSRRPEDLERAVPAVLSRFPADATTIAIGEPADGPGGWKLTHRQATAAFAVARRRTPTRARYREVALLAAALQDEVAATSLRRLYLAPLETERDGGEAACRTIRAYFAADHNLSAAAASLGVSRRTVANRLQAVERHLGCRLPECAAALEAAIGLHELNELPRAAPTAQPGSTRRSGTLIR